MSDEDWEAGFAKAIGFYLNGDAIFEKDQRGQHITDDSFVVLLNTGDGLEWTLPARWASPGRRRSGLLPRARAA